MGLVVPLVGGDRALRCAVLLLSQELRAELVAAAVAVATAAENKARRLEVVGT